jgi:hypothetical protein
MMMMMVIIIIIIIIIIIVVVVVTIMIFDHDIVMMLLQFKGYCKHGKYVENSAKMLNFDSQADSKIMVIVKHGAHKHE